MSTFRVLQFNMQFGQRWDDRDPDHAPIDLEGTIAEIRRHDPDIVFLQEVEQVPTGGAQVQPPPNYTRLREALAGMHSVFTYPKEDRRELPFGYGLAIFSKQPLAGVFHENIESPPVEFVFNDVKTTPTDRVLLGATTQAAGRELALINTHLLAFFMLKTTSEEHNGQRRQILGHLRAAQGPLLLSGDFNVSRHETLVAQFGEVGFTPVQQSEITWRRRPYVLDHIFYNAALVCRRCEVVPTMASDHHVLLADFEWAK